MVTIAYVKASQQSLLTIRDSFLLSSWSLMKKISKRRAGQPSAQVLSTLSFFYLWPTTQNHHFRVNSLEKCDLAYAVYLLIALFYFIYIAIFLISQALSHCESLFGCNFKKHERSEPFNQEMKNINSSACLQKIANKTIRSQFFLHL